VTTESLRVHGTTIAFGNRAILLRGKPGSGKSSLALMLMETTGNGLGIMPMSAKLVADDQTQLTLQAGKVLASAPPNLQGLLEVRGLGIMAVAFAAEAELGLVADLVTVHEISRLPDPAEGTIRLLGQAIPRIFLDASLPQSAARLRLAFRQLVPQS
jgi:HPr kinase/phosphorylase